jgi:hypothetical protein
MERRLWRGVDATKGVYFVFVHGMNSDRIGFVSDLHAGLGKESRTNGELWRRKVELTV